MKRQTFKRNENGYEAEWEVTPPEDLTDEADLYDGLDVPLPQNPMNPMEVLRGFSDNRAHEDQISIAYEKEDLLRFMDIKEQEEKQFNIRLDESTEYEQYKEGMEQLSDPDGSHPIMVWKRKLRRGTDKMVTLADVVTYHYQAFHEGVAEPFDSSVIRGKPVVQRLSVDPIVPGLLAGLVTMKLGEKSEFLVHYSLAYGELGCPPRIPAKADILFRVEIIKVHHEGSLECYNNLTEEERDKVTHEEFMALIDTARMAANRYFTDGNYQEAIRRYYVAIQQMTARMWAGEKQEHESRVLHCRLLTNQALCFIKLPRPVPAIKYAKMAIELDPRHSDPDLSKHSLKARYLLAKAYFLQGEYDSAQAQIVTCLGKQKGNEEFNVLFAQIAEKRNRDARRQSALLATMSRAIQAGKDRNQQNQDS